jgi:hypothetical protein
MRVGRLAALAVAVAIAAVLAGTARTADIPPSVGVVKSLTSDNPIACDGSVQVSVTVTGHAGEKGAASDIELVLDLSGSMGGTKRNLLKDSATKFVQAIAASDGDGNPATIGRGNRVGIVRYAGTSAAEVVALGTNADTLTGAISTLPSSSGNSPHDKGITFARGKLTGANARVMIVFSDGRSTSTSQRNAARSAAAAAKASPYNIRIITVGIGGDAATTELRDYWASSSASYQSVTANPPGVDAPKLLADTGAAVAVPAVYSLSEQLGPNFSSSDPLTLAGTLGEGETATLTFTATRNGDDVFSPVDELVGRTTTTVTGGATTVSESTIKVLPCGGTSYTEENCAPGAPCDTGTTQGGTQYAFSAGAPGEQTQVQLTGLSGPPPGLDLGTVCPGFGSGSDGVQVDVRPLTTDGEFEILIPDLTGSGRAWWQTDVCVGTNLRFITKINSLANLRPGADNQAGRWWGLLPSIPRYTLVDGKWVKGPWIKSRSKVGTNGARIVFVIPYVGFAGFTTNGEAAYDPKVFTAP